MQGGEDVLQKVPVLVQGCGHRIDEGGGLDLQTLRLRSRRADGTREAPRFDPAHIRFGPVTEGRIRVVREEMRPRGHVRPYKNILCLDDAGVHD